MESFKDLIRLTFNIFNLLNPHNTFNPDYALAIYYELQLLQTQEFA